MCSIVESSVVGQPVILTANASKAGPGSLTASCIGSETGEISVNVDQAESGIYAISFTPQQQDDYSLCVYFDKQPVPMSPFNITVTPQYDASKCIITDLPSESPLLVNSDIQFGVDATLAGSAELMILKTGSSLAQVSSSAMVTEDTHKKGYYHIKYIPTAPGEHYLHLTYGGDPIPDSPVHFKVVKISSGANSCYILPEDLPLSGSPCKFRISTAGAGKGTLKITTSGPKKVAVQIMNEGAIQLCELTLSKVGTYSVDILWNDEPIKNNPFTLCFEKVV